MAAARKYGWCFQLVDFPFGQFISTGLMHGKGIKLAVDRGSDSGVRNLCDRFAVFDTEIVTEDGVSCLISTVRESEAPISRLSRVSEERVA